MGKNIELKARCVDIRHAHRASLGLRCGPAELLRHRDTYFQCQDGRLKLRRIWNRAWVLDEAQMADRPGRPADRCELIWYRRDDEPRPRSSDYTLTTIEDGDALQAVLTGALGVAVVVDKQRSVYMWRNVRIHIDEVAGLGAFIEFEAIVDDTCDEPAAHEKIDRLSEAFGISPEQVVSVSYADLVAGE